MTTAILSIYLLMLAARHLLRWLNLRHLRRHAGTVPAGFEQAIDSGMLEKAALYTLARGRLEAIQSLAGSLVLLLLLFGGLLSLYDRWIVSLCDSFLLRGLLFFGGLFLMTGLLDIPFSLYRNFRLEARFGFNTLTFRLWLADLFKATTLSTLVAGLLTAGALTLVRLSPGWWWLWVWGFFALVTLFLIYLSPYVIEPLFFKFEPIRREELNKKIRALMEKAGLLVERVQQVDASRRSRHSNAYFTGIGKVKRIVLFDTLLEQMADEEVLAVLAHEAGHWKKGHVWKRLAVMEGGSLAAFYVAFRLLQWGGLPGLLGLAELSFYSQVVILAFLGALASFPLTPLFSWLSRQAERQADRFADGLTDAPQHLAAALVKLARENLANLHPHPLYAWFYYSHPPVVERVRKLCEVRSRRKG